MDFTKLMDFIKLPTRYIFSFALAAAAMLIFLPDSTMETLGILQLREQHRPWIGLLLVTSIAILVPPPLIATATWCKNGIKRRSRLRSLHKRLHRLSSGEKAVLRDYIEKDTKSQNLDITSGVVGGLVASGILFASSTIGDLFAWAHNIQPWAWEYLQKHPNLIADDRNESDPPGR